MDTTNTHPRLLADTPFTHDTRETARLTWMLLLLARTTGLAQSYRETLCINFVVRYKLKQVVEYLLRLDVVPWETTKLVCLGLAGHA